MEIELFTPDLKQAWDSFVRNTEGATCYHLSGWKTVFEETYHHRTYYLYAIENKKEDGSHRICGILPLVLIKSVFFGKFLISLPIFDHVGICADSKEAKSSLIEKAIEIGEKEKVGFIEVRQDKVFPKDNGGLFEELVAKSHKISIFLELPNSSGILWDSLKSNLRRKIRKPMKEGFKFSVGGLNQIESFYKIFCRNMRDLGTPVNPKLLFENILKEFPENSIIGVVSKNGSPVAAGLLIGFKGKLHMPWVSSLRKFNPAYPNLLLYWSLLEHACNTGYKVFDFGRSSPGGGTHKYKEQWNPKAIPLYWYYWIAEGGERPELNPDNPKFKTFIKIWQNLPLPLANILGPHIIRSLPQ